MTISGFKNQGIQHARSGFTLVEVVTSLAIMSVLMLGLSGAVMIGSHAVPTTTDIGLADQSVMNVTNQLRTEFRYCSRIQYRSNAGSLQMQLTMKSTTAAGAPSSVSYYYSAEDDTLSRIVDSLETNV